MSGKITSLLYRLTGLDKAIIVTACLLLTYALVAYVSNFHIVSARHTFTITQRDGKVIVKPPTATTLPFTIPIRNRQHSVVFDIDLEAGWRLPALLRIMSEGCPTQMTLNGAPIKLRQFNPQERCKYYKPIDVHVWEHMRPGINQLQLTLTHPAARTEAASNRIQLSIGNLWPSGMRTEIPLGIGFSVLFFLLLLRSPLGKAAADPVIAIMLTAGLVIQCYYLAQHSFIDFSHDIYGHRFYFKTLYEHHTIPHPFKGWLTYHPPLYYLLALPFYALGTWFAVGDPMETVRYFSYGCFLVFLFYGLATLHLLVKWKPAVYTGASLIIFWPASWLIATKANNDLMIYALFAACIYYFILWQQQGSRHYLWKAVAAALLTIATKNTYMALVPALMLATILHLRLKQIPLTDIRPSRRVAWIMVVLAVLCVGINIGRERYAELSTNAGRHFLIANTPAKELEKNWSTMTRNPVLVQETFLGLDPMLLIADPFKKHQALLWNRMLGTFLLNDMGKSYPALASFMTLFFLLVLAYTLLSAAWLFSCSVKVRERDWPWLAPLAVIAATLVGVIYLWLLLASGMSMRYIFYCMPWLMALYARSIEWHHSQGRVALGIAGLGLGASLAAMSLTLVLMLTYFSASEI